jgi:hypothetical protein
VSAATQAGRKAGRGFLSPSLNPFVDGTAEAAQWDQAWRAATAEELAQRDADRKQRAGCLAASGCSELGT